MVENRKRARRDIAGVQGDEKEMEEKPITPEEEFLRQATDCVMAHLDDSDFDRDAFALEMGASASTLYNRLREASGFNVSAFIRDIRMKEAYRLMQKQPDMRVSDLAYKVGYKDPKYFATCFKKAFGMQPTEFLKQASGKQHS
jgi:AraC-like DNA-binding protein